jgi:hypothetical protein
MTDSKTKESIFKVDPQTISSILSNIISTTEPDITLQIGEISINAHRNLLAAYSPIFQTIFESDPDSSTYTLDHDPITFMKFIDVLYIRPVILTFIELIKVDSLLNHYGISNFDAEFTTQINAETTTHNVYDAWRHTEVDEYKKDFEKSIINHMTTQKSDHVILSKITSEDDLYDILSNNLEYFRKRSKWDVNWLMFLCIEMWFEIHNSITGLKKLSGLIDFKTMLKPDNIRLDYLIRMYNLSVIDKDTFINEVIKRFSQPKN